MLVFIFLFISFFQIGFLGYGGNAGAQAFLEHELITLHHWLTPQQLTDLMVFCRTLPGGTGLNAASLTGFIAASARLGFWASVFGSIVSVIGLITPALIWTEIFAKVQKFHQLDDIVHCVMTLLRPLLPGLILGAAVLLMRADIFNTPSISPWEFGICVFLFAATIIGNVVYRINAGFLVILCGIAGWILF